MAHLGWIAAGAVTLIALWLLLVGQPAAKQIAQDHAIANETEVVWRRATMQTWHTPTPVLPCYLTRRC